MLVDTAATALTKTLEAPKLDPMLLGIANESLTGKSVQDIANLYDIPTDIVTHVLNKDVVKDYMNTVMLNQGYLHRSRRAALINKVIDAKVEESIETGVFSKKDLLEWIKLAMEEEKTLNPPKKTPQVAVQVNNYGKLLSDLMKEE